MSLRSAAVTARVLASDYYAKYLAYAGALSPELLLLLSLPQESALCRLKRLLHSGSEL